MERGLPALRPNFACPLLSRLVGRHSKDGIQAIGYSILKLKKMSASWLKTVLRCTFQQRPNSGFSCGRVLYSKGNGRVSKAQLGVTFYFRFQVMTLEFCFDRTFTNRFAAHDFFAAKVTRRTNDFGDDRASTRVSVNCSWIGIFGGIGPVAPYWSCHSGDPLFQSRKTRLCG